jgi:hypothetical protein
VSRIRPHRVNSRSDPGDARKNTQFKKGAEWKGNRKGGPGRRPQAWTRDFMEWCKGQLESADAQAKLGKRMWKLDRFGRSDPILSLIIQYAFGKPKAVVELTRPDLSMLSREELEFLVRIADRVGTDRPTPAGPKPLDLLAGSGGSRQTTH